MAGNDKKKGHKMRGSICGRSLPAINVPGRAVLSSIFLVDEKLSPRSCATTHRCVTISDQVMAKIGQFVYTFPLHMIVVWPRVSARNAGRLWSTLPFPEVSLDKRRIGGNG